MRVGRAGPLVVFLIPCWLEEGRDRWGPVVGAALYVTPFRYIPHLWDFYLGLGLVTVQIGWRRKEAR